MTMALPHQLPGRPGWYFRAKDPARGDKWVRLKAGDTYEAAILAQADFEKRAELMRRGVVTAQQLRDAERGKMPIPLLLKEWRESLEARRKTQSVIERWITYVELITQDRMPPIKTGGNMKNAKRGPAGAHGARTLGDLDPNAIDRYLNRLMRPPYNRATNTRNEYLVAIKAFTAWGRGTNKNSPLDCLHKLNPKRDPRIPRRALTIDEFYRLIDSMDHLTPSGRSRGAAWYRAYYLAAGRLGGRGTELARLRWEHVRKSEGLVHFAAEITKTGEAGDVELVEEVRRAFDALEPDQHNPADLVFGSSPQLDTFKRHLKRAGIDYKLDGQVVSLRKTLASHAIAAGAKPAELQLIMRHRNIGTTFTHYRDINLVDTASTMEAIGRPRASEPGQQQRNTA